jgi:hypothetical protein
MLEATPLRESKKAPENLLLCKILSGIDASHGIR